MLVTQGALWTFSSSRLNSARPSEYTNCNEISQHLSERAPAPLTPPEGPARTGTASEEAQAGYRPVEFSIACTYVHSTRTIGTLPYVLIMREGGKVGRG